MKLQPLIVDYLIPDYVKVEIDELINYVNTNDNALSIDCYECEVYSAINSALQNNILTQRMADELIDYYVYRRWVYASH